MCDAEWHSVGCICLRITASRSSDTFLFYKASMAEEIPNLYTLFWLHLLSLLNDISLASVSNEEESLGCEVQQMPCQKRNRCCSRRSCNTSPARASPPGELERRHRLCPAPADRFTNTAYHTSHVSTAAQSSCCKPRAGFSLSCSQLTLTFPTSCFQFWRDNVLLPTAFSKMLQVNLSQMCPAVTMNFSFSNPPWVQRLRRAPGQSTISESSLLLWLDIADDVGEH